MEHMKPFDSFAQDAHDKAQHAIDHAREVREQRIADGKKAASEPRLIADGSLKRCSVCGYPFQSDQKPSMSVAFADHLNRAHKPGEASEDMNQATARIVRENNGL
jgi:hypothetical protein